MNQRDRDLHDCSDHDTPPELCFDQSRLDRVEMNPLVPVGGEHRI